MLCIFSHSPLSNSLSSYFSLPLLSSMMWFYAYMYIWNLQVWIPLWKNPLFSLSGAAGWDLCADQYSAWCFSAVWILMQPCLTGYNFDTVPSPQPLNISSRDPRAWLAHALTAADWLRVEGGRRMPVHVHESVQRLLACWPRPPRMSPSDVWWWMGGFGPIPPCCRCLASSCARQD